MGDFEEKLQELENKVKAYREANGLDAKRSDNDVKSELHEITELLKGMQPKQKSKLDERFEKKKRRNGNWY